MKIPFCLQAYITVLDVLKIIWKDTQKLFAFSRMALNLQAKPYYVGLKKGVISI